MGRVTDVRCAVIGYGGAFNMGKHHADMMERTGVMKVVAVCDVDPKGLKRRNRNCLVSGLT